MSKKSRARFIRAHRLYEGGRAFSQTFGECVIISFSSDGRALIAPEAGACPFGEVRIRDLSPDGGEA